MDERVVAIDPQKGTELWAAYPKAALRNGRPTIHSLAIVDSRVIVVLTDNTVVALSLESGEILASGGPTVGGASLITDEWVYFKHPWGLATWDHREMKEVDRIEYEAEAAELYGTRPRKVHAFSVTADTVVWSTSHGALMAVELRPQGRHRRFWSDFREGGLMPIAQPPFSWGRWLYYEWRGAARALRAYEGAPQP